MNCRLSNITSCTKKPHQYLHQHQIPGQDCFNACYQIGGSNNNQNSLPYPPPPSYNSPMHHTGHPGAMNQQPFQTTPGLFGCSRAASPIHKSVFPFSNVSCNSMK